MTRTHTPRRRFGQNFLRDKSVIGQIIDAIHPASDDRIVEIGPGQGALTQTLADVGSELHLIEIDRDLVTDLRKHFASQTNVVVHQADALRCDYAEVTQGRFRIVGNLPYNISTPLLFRLFDLADRVIDMHFMLQREVVDRLTSRPGSPDYGRLTVMARYHCEAERLFDVAPDSFFPQPKVWSAVVRLVPHASPRVAVDLELLRRVVATAFSQRRKTLRNSLGSLITPVGLDRCGIDGSLRAEKLDLEDFARIANEISECSGG